MVGFPVNEPVLDAKLKFWRRLVVDQHPLLRGYQRHLQSRKEDNMLRPSTEHGSFQHPYLANVTRFMLCAMRSRERSARYDHLLLLSLSLETTVYIAIDTSISSSVAVSARFCRWTTSCTRRHPSPRISIRSNTPELPNPSRSRSSSH